MKRKYWILVIIVPAVFIIDQLTKWLILTHMEIGERIAVIPGFFDIVHFRNTGAAFGLFSGMSAEVRVPFFYVVAIIAVVVLALMYRAISDREVLMPVALSLVFGGIAGNVLDRIRLNEVVDFLSFHVGNRVFATEALGRRFILPLEWPAFNVADMAITMAMILIVISALRRRKGFEE
jgi:signal peptidase II